MRKAKRKKKRKKELMLVAKNRERKVFIFKNFFFMGLR